jgi:hypothetical protein
MRFGNCPECKEYKYIKENTGICQTCEDNGKADIDDLLDRASVTPEEIREKLNK